MKKIIIALTIFFLSITNIWSEVQMGGSFESRAWYSDETVSTNMLLRNWFRVPLEDDHSFIFQTAILTFQNGISLTPDAGLSFFGDSLILGTNMNFVLDSNQDELEFMINQGMFVNVLNEWKHFSFDVRGEHRFDYVSSFPQNRGRITANTFFHIREDEHVRPYPWTITLGPEFSWRYAFNQDENYYRDILTQGTKFEYKALSQGEDDSFPRAWNPSQSITFVNRWERQEYGVNSFDWVWDPSVRMDFSIEPIKNLRLSSYADIPLIDIDHELYRENQFSIGLSLRVRLY